MADQDDTTISKDGYDLTFYPGFASRCIVTKADGSVVELYRQTETYRLPQGETQARDRYTIMLAGGEKKQNVGLDVHDPERRVKRIVVELYGDDHEPGTGKDSPTADTLSLDNHTFLCPPVC